MNGGAVGNKTSFRRDCDLTNNIIKHHIFTIRSETRPHLEGIATSVSVSPLHTLTSETRPHLEGIATEVKHFLKFSNVGNKTSFRRDCDSTMVTHLVRFRSCVGNKTSFRRDCDRRVQYVLSAVRRYPSETRPHLEGIATR